MRDIITFGTAHRLMALFFVLAFQAANGYADVTVRDGGNQQQAAVEKAQYMLRQISLERDALKAENERLQEEIAKRDKKVDDLKSEVARTSKSLGNSQELVGRYQKTVEAQRDRMAEMHDKFQMLVDKYRELVAALKLVEAERTGLQDKVADQIRVLESCADKNKELYDANLKLLKQYEHKGVWDALLQKEPVTQLKRVQIENMVAETRYQLEKLKATEVQAAVGE